MLLPSLPSILEKASRKERNTFLFVAVIPAAFALYPRDAKAKGLTVADAKIPKQSSKTKSGKTQPIEPQPIKTQRLILREARMTDLGALHELYNNKDVMQYW